MLYSQKNDISHVSPCSHEEVDRRVLLHIKDISRQGIKYVKLRAVDVHNVGIAVALCV